VAHTLKADDTVLRVLRASVIDDAGLTLQGQLSRPDYVAVNKFLEVAGAKWNRKAARHLFSTPQAKDKIEALLDEGTIRDDKKCFNYFPTPSALAQRMVDLAGIKDGESVLEPSAGSGAILRAIRASHPRNRVVAVEINEQMTEIVNMAHRVFYGDFLDWRAVSDDTGTFNRILMNPPFEADIKHIQHAIKFLKPGGRLVAICAGGPRQQAVLQPLAENSGGIWEPLEPGTFKESGTMVNAVLLTIEG
jgi:phospholipid N-methyltransferase